MVIPFFAHRLSAGFPSAAEGYEDDPLDLHKWLVPHPAATFFYRAKGTNHDEHILDGSVLVVDRSLTPWAGCLAMVERDGEFAVERLDGFVGDAADPLRVVGVITAVVTRL